MYVLYVHVPYYRKIWRVSYLVNDQNCNLASQLGMATMAMMFRPPVNFKLTIFSKTRQIFLLCTCTCTCGVLNCTYTCTCTCTVPAVHVPHH